MKKLIRLISVFLAIFLLSGLSFQFNIAIEQVDLGSPRFKFSRESFLMGRQSIELNSFRVVVKNHGEWDSKNPVWAFQLTPGSALEISEFRYGETPHGFRETTKAEQLVPGTEYMAYGSGPGSTGAREFVIK